MIGDPVTLGCADCSSDNQAQDHRESKIDTEPHHHDRG